MKPLPQKYNPQEAEKRWQEQWETSRTYAWDSSQPRENTYSIDTPPPTVSGLLHMGHVYSYTHADFIARYQRMSGKTVFYPIGFDDNGLPTERLVEKVKKIRATQMSREDFIKVCEDVVEDAEKDFRALFRSIALSVDWNEEYQTVSEHSRRISQLSFLDLFEQNEVERRLQPMLWDPMDQTALAQAEVEDKEHASHSQVIPFKLITDAQRADLEKLKWDEIDEEVEIMTTRPELLAACVALMAHPDSQAELEKKELTHAVTPLFNVAVPIRYDEQVDQEKGTGFVMCCTFGDETDIQWWRTHQLPMRIILNKYGKIELAQEGAYRSDVLNWDDFKASIEPLLAKKARTDARAQVVAMLEEAGLLRQREAITHQEPCAERSGAPLEILPTPQWFVKVLDKKEALKAKAAEVNWHPEWMRHRMDQWIDGLGWDWCISRQRYFGVPFPVWYSKREGEEGKVLVAHPDDLPVNPLTDLPRGYSREEVDADPDVMDTWATSSVSPQINSHALNDTYTLDAERHAKLYPADLRAQAHEIIRTWAFYSVVKSHLHADSIPWKNTMISGWCLASDKTKMSKSKGNVVTPVDLIETRGADSVRYWASTAKLGTDTAFSEDVLKIGKKLVTKLWNASKFAAMQLENLEGTPSTAAQDIADGKITETLDRWIISRLHRAIEKATAAYEGYEYADARMAAEDFFWNDFCDNYLELIKARAYGNAEEGDAKALQQSAVYALYHCLKGVLKLFAPIVPHITEELYSHIFDEEYAQTGSIHARGNWPKLAEYPADEAAERAGQHCVMVLEAIRKLKSEREVSIKWPLENVTLSAGSEAADWDALQGTLGDLKAAGNAAEITWGDAGGDASVTDGGIYHLAARFAEKEDAA